MAALLALVAQPGHGAAGICLVHRFPPRGDGNCCFILNILGIYAYRVAQLYIYIIYIHMYMYNVYV